MQLGDEPGRNFTAHDAQTKPGALLRRGWWFEPEFLLVFLLAIAFYSIRVSDLSIRGEESRRGRIAWEMWNTGDWIVPRIQGEPVFYRPPLQNWLIALAGMCRGEFDGWAVRLPSVAAVVLTVVVTYGFTRSLLSPFGAFFSALCLASLGQVLELGRLGETDALFTLFLAGSLLTWKWCWNARLSPYAMWVIGYTLAGLATLTKGPQAPLYFVGSVSLFCLATGHVRQLFCRAHVAGILAGLAVVMSWQIPYTLRMGLGASINIYFHDVGPRFHEMTLGKMTAHLVTYPIELLAGSLMPWSVWLVLVFSRPLRMQLLRWREDVLYLLVCMGIAFPSVWFAPGASLRYYMSLFPCFACLIGIVIEGFSALPQHARWTSLIGWYQRILAGAIFCAGTGIAVLSAWRQEAEWAQSARFAAFYFTVCLAATVGIWLLSKSVAPRALMISFTIVAGFLGVTISTLTVNIRQRSSEDARQAVQALKDEMPAGTRLVSLGPAHHLFLFHLAEPVRIVDLDADDPAAWGTTDYFCIWTKHSQVPQLSFPWEPVTKISCDRNRTNDPTEVMIVGRRKSTTLASKHSATSPHL